MADSRVGEWLTSEGLTLLEGWARDGLTNEQIAENMGISESTFYKWKKEHPEISQALKEGKAVVDRKVENALLRRALGFTIKESRIETQKDGETKHVTIWKDVPPDVTACIFWLKNRKPEEWRNKPEPPGAFDDLF
ncbi:MAG: helix-turn-helix domain-containing protein [Lachnospiraceae bacterium]|nr:helix-turn-helix domain-containing protein [Lachnospiraceae bacterium]